jgi:hypothetical protein
MVEQINRSKISRLVETGLYVIVFEVDSNQKKLGINWRIPAEMSVYRGGSIELEAMLYLVDGHLKELEIITPDSSEFDIDVSLSNHIIFARIERPLEGSTTFGKDGNSKKCFFYDKGKKPNDSILAELDAYRDILGLRIENCELTALEEFWLNALLLDTGALRRPFINQINHSRLFRNTLPGKFSLKFEVNKLQARLAIPDGSPFEMKICGKDEELATANLYVSEGYIDELRITSESPEENILSLDLAHRCVKDSLRQITWEYLGDRENS